MTCVARRLISVTGLSVDFAKVILLYHSTVVVVAGDFTITRKLIAVRRRMRRLMHLFQVRDRHMRVDLRRLQARVTEDLLDDAHVGAALEHQRRHRMTEEMTRALLPDLRSL